MRCEAFLTACSKGEESPEMLQHLRSCNSCLQAATEMNPDLFFRSLGGEMIPPGGVDAFVGGVMNEIHVRSAERRLMPRRTPLVYRWSIAAALALTLGGTMVLQRQAHAPLPLVNTVPHSVASAAVAEPRPVIESYGSQNATIIEVPAQETGDVKLVMVFDESLPADL